MATPQELYDETKTRLDLNIAKAQMLEKEIQQKTAEKNQLMQTIIDSVWKTIKTSPNQNFQTF